MSAPPPDRWLDSVVGAVPSPRFFTPPLKTIEVSRALRARPEHVRLRWPCTECPAHFRAPRRFFRVAPRDPAPTVLAMSSTLRSDGRAPDQLRSISFEANI